MIRRTYFVNHHTPTRMRHFVLALAWMSQHLLLPPSSEAKATSSSTSGRKMQPQPNSHPNMVNMLAPQISLVKASRSSGNNIDSQQQPHDDHDQRKLVAAESSSTLEICNEIIQKVFATSRKSLEACTCSANSPTEYLLECDYSSHCGTFCSNEAHEGKQPFECFTRMDRYIVQVTDDDYVNTLYEGCGTYVTEGTRVCLMELRDLNGNLDERCLSIDGMPCQCHRGACGDFVFQCIRPRLPAPWESFVVDECNELESYGQIPPGQVHGLLSSNVFSHDSCFSQQAAVAKTDFAAILPSNAPTTKPTSISNFVVAEPGVYCTGIGCTYYQQNNASPTTQSPNSPPTDPPTRQPTTEQPSKAPTLRPTTKPTSHPTSGPTTSLPTKPPTSRPTTSLPTSQPTASATARSTGKPTTVSSQTTVPTLTPSAAPTTENPTLASPINITESASPSADPSQTPTRVPTAYPWPTLTPTKSQAPTIETVDLALEPFALIFALTGDHTQWRPPAMIRAIQQVFVNSLRQSNGLFGKHDYSRSMHNFRLQCSWVDRQDYFTGPVTESRLECTGNATLRVKDNDTGAMESDLVDAQAAILLQDKFNLSLLLSNQLGETVEVRRVEMDAPIKRDDKGRQDIESSGEQRVRYHLIGMGGALALAWTLL